MAIDLRSLESIKSSIEKAQTAVRTAWTPDAETIIKDLDTILLEVNRAIHLAQSKVVMRSEDLELLTTSPHYVEPLREDIAAYPAPRFFDQKAIVDNVLQSANAPVNHQVFHEDPKSTFGFNCTCPRNENHTFSTMTEAEVAEHIDIDAVTRGDYDTEGGRL